MRALIVLAHPEPASFNGQMAAVAAATLTECGYAVEISLRGEHFNVYSGPERIN